jgi:hypothetical protein
MENCEGSEFKEGLGRIVGQTDHVYDENYDENLMHGLSANHGILMTHVLAFILHN